MGKKKCERDSKSRLYGANMMPSCRQALLYALCGWLILGVALVSQCILNLFVLQLSLGPWRDFVCDVSSEFH